MNFSTRWLPSWRREALRTKLWLVPALMVALVVGLFIGTYGLDRAVYRQQFLAAIEAVAAEG